MIDFKIKKSPKKPVKLFFLGWHLRQGFFDSSFHSRSDGTFQSCRFLDLLPWLLRQVTLMYTDTTHAISTKAELFMEKWRLVFKTILSRHACGSASGTGVANGYTSHYTLSMWNCYWSVAEGLLKTNCAVEDGDRRVWSMKVRYPAFKKKKMLLVRVQVWMEWYREGAKEILMCMCVYFGLAKQQHCTYILSFS